MSLLIGGQGCNHMCESIRAAFAPLEVSQPYGGP